MNTTAGVKEPAGRVLAEDSELGLFPVWEVAGALAPWTSLERPGLQVECVGTRSPKKGSEQHIQEKRDAGR